MENKMKDHGKKIDPLDPKFNEPRKSKKYSQMYEGHVLYRIPSPQSKKGYKTVSVYEGIYYKADQTAKERKRYLVTLGCLFLLVSALFIVLCVTPLTYNANPYVGIAESITVVALVYMAITLFFYITIRRDLTAYTYKVTSHSLIRGCSAVIACLGLCLLADGAAVIIDPAMNVWHAVIGAAGFVACGLGIVYLRNMEKKLVYKSWKSTDKPQADAS